MKSAPVLLIIAVALALALASFATAVNVPIAPAGHLPDEGIRLSSGELGNPSAIDAVSFYASPPDTMMVSNLYPISRDVCDRHAGSRTMVAEPGDYCMMLDSITYTFTLTQISGSIVGVLLPTQAGGGGGGSGGPMSTLPSAENETQAPFNEAAPAPHDSPPPTTSVEGGTAGENIITPTTRLTAFSLSLVITIGCLALAALIVRWLQ